MALKVILTAGNVASLWLLRKAFASLRIMKRADGCEAWLKGKQGRELVHSCAVTVTSPLTDCIVSLSRDVMLNLIASL